MKIQKSKGKKMKKLISIFFLSSIFLSPMVYAGGIIKEVCTNKLDKDGKIIVKSGKPLKDCKKIKVHKKFKGTKVPEKK